jgi:hypothetical protein
MIETKIDTPQGTTLKKQQFEEQLIAIDSKYQRWFGQRNHPFSVQLHLKEGLPLEIGKDCRLAFENIFQN